MNEVVASESQAKKTVEKKDSKVVNLEDSAKFLMAKRGSKDKHNKAS
jgi:hypothetical protein